MSAPVDTKAGVKAKRPLRAAKPQAVPAAELSALEIRAALAVRRLAPEMKKRWTEILEGLAAKYELEDAAARPAPILRLVSGGAR